MAQSWCSSQQHLWAHQCDQRGGHDSRRPHHRARWVRGFFTTRLFVYNTALQFLYCVKVHRETLQAATLENKSAAGSQKLTLIKTFVGLNDKWTIYRLATQHTLPCKCASPHSHSELQPSVLFEVQYVARGHWHGVHRDLGLNHRPSYDCSSPSSTWAAACSFSEQISFSCSILGTDLFLT